MALSILFGMASLAQAQRNKIVDATDPELLLKLMEDDRYEVELDTDSDGDPIISGEVKRQGYAINFYGCRNGKNCKTINFFTKWDRKGDVSGTTINKWNREKFWGKAYLDKNEDPILEWSINMDEGVTGKMFLDSVEKWHDAVKEFDDHIE